MFKSAPLRSRPPAAPGNCRLRLVLLASLVAASAAVQADETLRPDTMAARMVACTACHGAQGKAGPDGYYPRIAGKPADYLYNQLLHFRDGRRQYRPMTHLLENLSDAYLRDIANWFSDQHPPYVLSTGPAVPAAMLARGEALALHGDAARNVPACTACHGAAMAGVLPATPGLLGLPRDYISSQFGAWRTGLRQATGPDCMAEVARRMAPEDIAAVGAWLSTRTIPADARPAQTPPDPVLLATCGSHVATGRAAP